MKLPDEHERKCGLLKNYKNSATRYTPSLKNGQWVLMALVADAGWLLNLAFTITYFCLNGFHEEITTILIMNILYILSVIAIQIGYCFDIYTSIIGEKAQQTRLQKNIGFGVPTVGSFVAVIFGTVQAVCASRLAPEGICFIIISITGAFISFIGCLVIFRSFQAVVKE